MLLCVFAIDMFNNITFEVIFGVVAAEVSSNGMSLSNRPFVNAYKV